jgi:hypothetical protein
MKTEILRELIRAREFLHMPAVYDSLGGLLVQNSGFKVCFVGGYVTGAALAISEPLLTMTEQVALASAVADAIDLPRSQTPARAGAMRCTRCGPCGSSAKRASPACISRTRSFRSGRTTTNTLRM